MFAGEFTHTSDRKGRVSVPSTHRTTLQKVWGEDTLVVTPSFQGDCLWAFPPSELKSFSDGLMDRGLTGRALSKARRLLFAKGRSCVVDGAGRINIPEALRSKAAIGKDVLFAGTGRRIELWNPEHYAELDDSFEPGELDDLRDSY